VDHFAVRLVYLYASCDRGQVYPQLDQAAVYFDDRSPGCGPSRTGSPFGASVEITAANELDVVRNSSALPLNTDQPSNGCSFALPGTSRHRTASVERAARGRRSPGRWEFDPVGDQHLSPSARAAWNAR